MTDNPPQLQKDIDYYYSEEGLMIFTEEYLLKRGYCCRNSCLHCPYGEYLANPVPLN